MAKHGGKMSWQHPVAKLRGKTMPEISKCQQHADKMVAILVPSRWQQQWWQNVVATLGGKHGGKPSWQNVVAKHGGNMWWQNVVAT